MLEYILLSKAIIAVASPHYFSRGWCLFEFACKLATSTDFSALGVAWKAFVNFGSRKDGFDASLYVPWMSSMVHHGTSIGHTSEPDLKSNQVLPALNQ